jgi:hypothetical protein
MPNTINADNGVVSGITGIRTTADNTGNLALQSNGVTVLTLATNNTVTIAGTVTANSIVSTGTINALNTFGFENRIINGNMTIDQRNAGASVTPTVDPTYTLDRWSLSFSQASKFSVQQNAASVTPPTGFSNYAGATSLSAYSVVASDYFAFTQSIEGYNIADLGWGTANAKTVTVSFQVYSSLTGTFGGALRSANANRSYPFSYSVSTANTWTSISVTIAGDTSGTWLTTNGIGVIVRFGLGVGSTFSGTAGAWATGNYFAPTGAVSVVGTNGATFYITGVQFEVGSQATSFDFRSIGQELLLCQRYFVKTNPDNASRSGGSWGSMYSTTSAAITGNLPVTMRSAPTFVRGGTSDTFYINGINATSTGSTSLFSATTSWYSFEISSLSTSTLGNPVIYNGQASLSAEL